MITIRPFEASDQQAARWLILSGLGEHFGYIDESLNPDIDDIMSNYITARHVFIIAQSGENMVGTGALLIKDAVVGRIVRMSVSSAHRRRGIGKAIVEHLIAIARQRGLRRLLVETNNNWFNAIGLYKHLGFSEYERDSESVHMALNLS